MVVEALVPPDAARVATRATLASQQCTRMPQNDAEEPFPPICVHSCAPMSVRNGATVYTNAPKRLREVIFANLCTLLCPHGRSRTGRGHGSHDIDGPMAPVMLAQVLGPDTYATRAVTQPPTRTHFIVAGYRIPSRPQLASGGDPGDGSRGVRHGGTSPAGDVSAKLRDRARREGCHAAQTPDTYQPHATASCHAWGPAYT